MSLVAVCSKSFSKHELLKEELSRRFGECRFNLEGRELKGRDLIAFLQGATHAIIGLEKIDREILRECPQLKTIAKYGVGLDSIDFRALSEFGVKLGWRGGVNRRSVSELVLANMIVLLRKLDQANQLVRNGQWSQVIGQLLSEKTVGIVGLGHIGKDLCSLLKPFGCRILANDIVRADAFCKDHGILQVSLNEVLSESDIVSLHVPLDQTTRGLIGALELQRMKPTSLLINAARGGIVDEVALYDALKNFKIAGAAFDVFVEEPPLNPDLLNLPHFFATPHLGGSAAEAMLLMGRAAIDGLNEAVEARPENFR